MDGRRRTASGRGDGEKEHPENMAKWAWLTGYHGKPQASGKKTFFSSRQNKCVHQQKWLLLFLQGLTSHTWNIRSIAVVAYKEIPTSTSPAPLLPRWCKKAHKPLHWCSTDCSTLNDMMGPNAGTYWPPPPPQSSLFHFLFGTRSCTITKQIETLSCWASEPLHQLGIGRDLCPGFNYSTQTHKNQTISSFSLAHSTIGHSVRFLLAT